MTIEYTIQLIMFIYFIKVGLLFFMYYFWPIKGLGNNKGITDIKSNINI